MKKLLLAILCVCFASASYAQTSQARRALEKLIGASISQELTPAISVPLTGKGIVFDIARMGQLINTVAKRKAYMNQFTTGTIEALTKQAIAAKRSTIPEALLAYEILNQIPVKFYNAGQDDGHLWYAYRKGIYSENGEGRLVHSLDATYRQLRREVEQAIENMKNELTWQTTNSKPLFSDRFDVLPRLATIRDLRNRLGNFADSYLNKRHSFFLEGQDALSWFEYYYLSVTGNNCTLPISQWNTWEPKYR